MYSRINITAFVIHSDLTVNNKDLTYLLTYLLRTNSQIQLVFMSCVLCI